MHTQWENPISNTQQISEFLRIISTVQKVVKYQSSCLKFLYMVPGTPLHYLKSLWNWGIPKTSFTFVFAA